MGFRRTISEQANAKTVVADDDRIKRRRDNGRRHFVFVFHPDREMPGSFTYLRGSLIKVGIPAR